MPAMQFLTKDEIAFYNERLIALYRAHKAIRKHREFDMLLQSFRNDLQVLADAGLTWWQLKKLRRRMRKNFFKNVGELEEYCQREDYSFAAYKFRLSPAYIMVHNLKHVVDARKVSTQLAALTRQAPAAAIEPAPAPSRPVFPELAYVDKLVSTKLSWLRVRWETADRIPLLATDDRFVLDQIVTAYLPDSWKIFQELRGQSQDTIREASAMLDQQITALIQQVDDIIDRGGQNALSKLAAQTTFIATKTHTTPGLMLPAGK